MKTLNIIGASLSTLLIGLSFYYSDEVFFLKWRNSFRYDGYSSANYNHEALTIEFGLISLAIFTFLCYIFIQNKRQVKSTRIISIIGIFTTISMISWDFLVIMSPSHISFDEVGYIWMSYGIICILLFVLLLKKEKSENTHPEDIIDNFDID